MKTRGNRAVASSAQRPARGTLRVIGGCWKRTVIPVPDAPGLRPTPDRVRETVFNWLAHAYEGDLSGLSAVDLFAGSGALGIEAASRGAAPVVLIEQSRVAVEALRAIKARLAAEQLDIQPGDALRIGAQLSRAGRSFDLIFVDPPFASALLEPALAVAMMLSSAGGFVYVEAATPLTAAMLTVPGLEIYRSDKAGDVFYHLLRRKITEEETPC